MLIHDKRERMSKLYFYTSLKLLCNIQHQAFGLFPSETRVGNRLTKNMLAYALGTILQIAFNHQTLNQTLDITVLVTAVYDILGNTDLF